MMRNLMRMVVLIMMLGMLIIMIISLGCCDDEADVGSDDESYDHSKDQR